jgi:hypothetical protein
MEGIFSQFQEILGRSLGLLDNQQMLVAFESQSESECGNLKSTHDFVIVLKLPF